MPGMFAALAEALSHAPERIALVAREAGGERMLTRADLLAASGRYANALAALGVQAGDRVVAQVEKHVEGLGLYLGCLRLGAVYVPLNTGYTPAELAHFLGDAEPVVMVCEAARRDALQAVARDAGVRHLVALHGDEGIAARARTAAAGFVDVEPPELAAILYTSGTTGRSKGAMLTQANLLSNARTLVSLWGCSEQDVLIHALPTYHVHGLFVALHTALLSGAKVIFLPKFDAATVLDLLPTSTLMMGVPTFYTRLLEEPALDRARCAGMRLFVAGSAPLRPETFEEWEARTGQRILERYGMTETGMITSNPLVGERRAGSVGLPLPGVEVRLRIDGEVHATGGPGVLEVRGPNVFKGYWRMPEKTREEFTADGWFVTGDVAEIDAAGVVSLTGRAKDLIISGGLNVYPKEIELAIDGLPGVEESAVIGVPHRDFGEAVVAIVKPLAGATPDADAMLRTLRTQLAAFKVPKHVALVDELPRNAMGKVQKNLLRDQYVGLFKG